MGNLHQILQKLGLNQVEDPTFRQLGFFFKKREYLILSNFRIVHHYIYNLSTLYIIVIFTDCMSSE